MKKCKLYRLLSRKDGKFDLKGQKELLRSDAIVHQNYIDEHNASSENSGLFYEVDEEATAELNGEAPAKTAKAPAKTAKADLEIPPSVENIEVKQ